MVVSDINMPRMDGLSLLAKLQEAEDKKSTIIVSAYGDMSNIRTAMNRGAFDFLTKPIDFADLEMTIEKTIRHIEMLREVRRRQTEAERAHAALSRHFSPELAKRLAASGESEGIEVQWRDIATIFTDITGFTSLVESAPPETLGMLLNEYVGGMTEIAFAHEGMIVLLPGPWYPPQMPLHSSVGRNHMRSSGRRPRSPASSGTPSVSASAASSNGRARSSASASVSMSGTSS